MKYDGESGRIIISADELILLAKRGIARTTSYSADKEKGAKDSNREPLALTYEFVLGEQRYLLTGRADEATECSITVIGGYSAKPTKEERALSRGKAFLLGYMLAKSKNLSRVELINIYRQKGAPEESEERELVNLSKLQAFLDKCLASLMTYGMPEADRVTKRVPSLKNVNFPYQNRREGQDEFIRKAYKNLTRGGTLFACAPTGTGKTVSVIYPALRAVGTGGIEKVFYLTPKNTTARAAADCANDFAAQGANICAIQLSAKERICPHANVCRDNKTLCPVSKNERLSDAVIELYNESKTVITDSDCRKAAEKYAVCPHELELAYSEICDLVICDFNYLFDPRAYIRRYFDEGGRYAFLIDEAHNLVERARDMYSSELSVSDFNEVLLSELISPVSKLRKILTDALGEFTSLLIPYLSEDTRRGEDGRLHGAAHLSLVPYELYGFAEELTAAVQDELKIALGAKDEEATARVRIIKDFSQKVEKLSSALELFGDGFKLFIFRDGDEVRLKLFCIDPGAVIRTRLERGRSAVFFSATLTPIDYYRAVLGGGSYSDTLEVGSPFQPEQLSVSIIDKISTRYSERERTLPAICRTVASVMSAKRGNYMVYCPSFEYVDMLYEAFTAKYPKINALKQKRDMKYSERQEFLAEFEKKSDRYLVGFCVLGGVYSEGIDLTGDSLIGAVVVSIGMPALSYEREAMAEYFEDKYEAGKLYAYIYPGMNRVFQAAGRVIRTEGDKGVIVLIDDRFADPIYKKHIPDLWRGMSYVSDAKELKARIEKFWGTCDNR